MVDNKNSIRVYLLFTGTLLTILMVYLYLFGLEMTVEIVKEERLIIIALLIISGTVLYLKNRLKNHTLINFIPTNTVSLQSSVGFFLLFQISDYFIEDGFIGMIRQWFLYWIMGLFALLLLQLIHYYKNYTHIYKRNQ